ncbi:dTMP kinase [Solemya velum gill symbiont]|uniref:Thymidylate kinase n=1 Tax=Solemya velum gill symbiont TaxID=2340 RepID=A0A0B0H7F6_SOVGS|nr:dTMP kinase [Solemya velum gill symbiont]KHF26128.1 thymidylate kinase [Solemya velum gill symbiont]OOY35854.1 dTMP kinase [Solemya velum gill symbiont]OOY38695.1 dTMP kinase [Solemya velum gill symbiont]OOY40359.1 dTMP kinase [Solemya velum gill symbiont]OOY45391.1 dTMP kinase [Solemya velum gill symbiont]
MSLEQALFITVEGIEGAGKSSNIAYLQELLEKRGHELLMTREPGGTELGEQLRELLLGHKHDGMSYKTELLMMFAARAEHLHAKILPALAEGKTVICDRFTDATYAYQGGGRLIDIESIRLLESFVQEEVRPDLTLLLDLPVNVGMARANQRSAPDRFEKERHDFFERVRNAYLEIARQHKERVKVIDASKPLEQVQLQLSQVMTDILGAAE